jgi:hypothetical protein
MAIVTGLSPKIAVPAIVALVIIATAAGLPSMTRRNAGPSYDWGERVPASIYEWPPGCLKRDYRKHDRLPKTCTYRRGYKLTNPTELGLSVGKGEVWYQVGDDALLLDCQTWGRDCIIRNSVPGKFTTERQ